jgi:aryl-alcohol dehydrogenase-like predicted oxidoreductase
LFLVVYICFLFLLGKAHHIALSEASPATIRRAHAISPLYAIEQEWSLWSRDIEDEIVPTCRELGIKIVAYSPLGRGFLTGSIRGRDDPKLDANDFRLKTPKFAEGNIEENLKLVDSVKELADKKGITSGQLALAWLHSQGDDVIPIPGTSSTHHFDQNYAATTIKLTEEDKNEIDKVFGRDAVKGDRYYGTANTFQANK